MELVRLREVRSHIAKLATDYGGQSLGFEIMGEQSMADVAAGKAEAFSTMTCFLDQEIAKEEEHGC